MTRCLCSFQTPQLRGSDRNGIHAPVMLTGGYAAFLLVHMLFGQAKADCGRVLAFPLERTEADAETSIPRNGRFLSPLAE